MPLTEDPQKKSEKKADFKADFKEEEKTNTGKSKKKRWELSGKTGLKLMDNSKSVIKSTSYSVHDIEPDPFKQAMANMKLYKIMNNEPVDYSDLSMNEKKTILLLLGGRAREDYDFDRKKSYNDNSISLEDFKKNFIDGWEADIFIAKAQKKNENGEWVVPDEAKGELFKNLADLLDVPVSEIEKLWGESENNADFKEKLHEKYFKAGVCRDISVFQAKIAADMGLKDTFSTTVSTPKGAHVIMGFRNEKGNISFVDYGGLLETDTRNMKLALSVLEQYKKSLALNYMQSEGKEEGNNLILIKSKASEILEDIARGSSETASEEMSKSMDKDKLEIPSNAIRFSIDNEHTNLELNLETIAGSTIISSDIYNLQKDKTISIKDVYSARVAQEYGGEHIRGGISGAFAHIRLKPLEGIDDTKAKMNKFFLSLYGKMHEDIKINKYLRYRVAAMVDTILDIGLDKGEPSSYQANIGSQHRLYLITPSLDLYVGLKNVHSFVPSNLKQLPTEPNEIAITNDLLATNIGADVRLGQWSGYKVNFNVQGEIGTEYLDKATEYSGKVGMDISNGQKTVFLDTRGSYVDSKDFRINEKGQIEGGIGYVTPISGGALHLRGYAFDSKSLGEFKDSRLDQWGAGFDMYYYF